MNLYRPTKHFYNLIVIGFDQSYNMRCVKIYRKTTIVTNIFYFLSLCTVCESILKQIRDSVLFSTHLIPVQHLQKVVLESLADGWNNSCILTMMVDSSWGKSDPEQRFWPLEQSLHRLLGEPLGLFRHWSTLECGKRQFITNFFLTPGCTISKSLSSFPKWGKQDMKHG